MGCGHSNPHRARIELGLLPAVGKQDLESKLPFTARGLTPNALEHRCLEGPSLPTSSASRFW